MPLGPNNLPIYKLMTEGRFRATVLSHIPTMGFRRVSRVEAALAWPEHLARPYGPMRIVLQTFAVGWRPHPLDTTGVAQRRRHSGPLVELRWCCGAWYVRALPRTSRNSVVSFANNNNISNRIIHFGRDLVPGTALQSTLASKLLLTPMQPLCSDFSWGVPPPRNPPN